MIRKKKTKAEEYKTEVRKKRKLEENETEI